MSETSETSDAFDLNALIREVVRADTSGDMNLMAKAVKARIPTEEFEAALDQCLPRYVYDVARGRRDTTAGRAAPRPPQPARPNRSAKVRGIREGWRDRMEEYVAVTPGKFKPFGDCTFDDLEYAAALRFQLAEANRGAGRSLKVLAALLREHRVEIVRKLPEAVLADYFGARRAA